MSSKTRPPLTHLTAAGEAHMVDIGAKEITARRAIARARVRMSAETFALLTSGKTPKGDVLATARIAGIQAAKRTSELIPLCHVVAITRVEIAIALDSGIAEIHATAEALDRTGVEMEALVAASTAALTIYDMLKAVDRSMSFDVCLSEKAGGKSGSWKREQEDS
jgi:cyclic pyranopterin monophosphate synthase